VIVGLMHEDIGHLGIFVSGRVAKKEHAQIVSVLKSIESLPPGVYAMEILESEGDDGKPVYDVRFEERQLEEICERLNRYRRADEKPFEAVAAVSDFNQRAYELFAQPLVQAMSNEHGAKLLRDLHPLRAERWAVSDLNPWLAWLGPAANLAWSQRQALGADAPSRRAERMLSDLVSASLDYYREIRDAASEAMFFNVYGNLFSLYLADKHESRSQSEPPANALDLPIVKDALAAVNRGGYAEALSRLAALLASDNRYVELAQLELKRDLVRDYAEHIPQLPPEQWRRIRGEQDIIVRYARDQALATFPQLLGDPGDRERFLGLLKLLLDDPRLLGHAASEHDAGVIAAVRKGLGSSTPQLAAVKRTKRA
jgi:hypothetical protein